MLKRIRLTRNQAIIAALVLMGLAATALIVWWPKKTVTTIPVTPMASKVKPLGDKQSSSSAKPGSSTNTINDNSNSPTSSVSSTPPASPSGSFVSNHLASISSTPQEESTCVTTPGASCYIEFTNGSTTLKLPAQITDDSSSTVWDWDIKTAGLSAGSWQVKAIASLNNQTRSTDGAPLEVSP